MNKPPGLKAFASFQREQEKLSKKIALKEWEVDNPEPLWINANDYKKNYRSNFMMDYSDKKYLPEVDGEIIKAMIKKEL